MFLYILIALVIWMMFFDKGQKTGKPIMAPYHSNIETKTLENKNYRKVEYTVPGELQLVLMRLLPGEEIGAEVHPHTTQFFRVEKGTGLSIIGDQQIKLTNGSVIIVPYGSRHNIINTSDFEDLHLYTLYSPPNHPPNTIQPTKPLND